VLVGAGHNKNKTFGLNQKPFGLVKLTAKLEIKVGQLSSGNGIEFRKYMQTINFKVRDEFIVCLKGLQK
jgi:hypothetical protein